MLLGVPSVAANVGGVKDLMVDEREGRIYEAGHVGDLAQHILELFAMEDRAADMGRVARKHALVTHDPEKNLNDLLAVYETLK